MTIGETKARIRRARTLMRELRNWINSHNPSELPDHIELSRLDYEDLEWGMGHLLKDWLPSGHDADGEAIGPWRLVRIRGTFTRNDGTDNFLFKGLPVRQRG